MRGSRAPSFLVKLLPERSAGEKLNPLQDEWNEIPEFVFEHALPRGLDGVELVYNITNCLTYNYTTNTSLLGRATPPALE